MTMTDGENSEGKFDRYSDKQLLSYLAKTSEDSAHWPEVQQELVRRFTRQYTALATGKVVPDQGKDRLSSVQRDLVVAEAVPDQDNDRLSAVQRDSAAQKELAELLSHVNGQTGKHDQRFGCLWLLLIAIAVVIGLNTAVVGGVIFGVVAALFLVFLTAVFPAKRFVAKEQYHLLFLAERAGMSRESLNEVIQKQYKNVAKNWPP
jgi:hypothetical protein